MNADALSYLAHVISDQGVSSARAVGLAPDGIGGGFAAMTASDGARWTIYVDRHAIAYGWGDSPDEAQADWIKRAQATR